MQPVAMEPQRTAQQGGEPGLWQEGLNPCAVQEDQHVFGRRT